MTAPGSAPDPVSALTTPEALTAAIRAAGLDPDRAGQPGPAALASPSYLALESASVLLDGPEGAVFLKVMHPEMRAGFDLPAAMQLARQAGAAGAGPRVVWSDNDMGAIAMQALTGPDWHRASQHMLQDPDVVAGAMQALRRLHATAPLPQRFDPFAQIDAQIAALEGLDALPDDIGWLRRLTFQCRALCRDMPLVPCRNDGAASNLMRGASGQVLLVDYDRAGMNDPMYDLGCLLAEITDFPQDMRAGYIAYAGRFDEAGFARARLWSVVDDMLHALWARRMSRVSARPGVEWLKYGEWRLMRLRLALNHPDFEQMLRLATQPRTRVAA
ncbi:MAG: phosphotransferase family protein [Paracoccus sp. (in: a-proteobacteria)]|uniref:phosphotransferase family protein n=1 Tax=Paracoccus sp. TaxID=267 RepID=UPI00391C3AFB